MSKIFYAKKVQELNEIAKAIVEVFENEKKFVFFGEMGVGKTTLIKYICKVLNVQDVVTSPTFSVVNQYRNKDGNILYHFDLYRIENQEELFDLGLEEYIYSDNYCFIEWPEKAEGLLSDNFVQVQMIKNKEYRIIKVITS